jgi:heme-degrading monooxygenase HmoA
MVIVVFQFSTKPNMSDEYFNEVELLKKELENEKGFISAERYKSTTDKDSYVSISTWKDKKSVVKWHQNKKHQLSQNKGKAEIFKSFRIRVAEVYKDYSFS